MEATTNSPPTQHVYRAHGTHTVRVPICDLEHDRLLQVPTIADLIPARRIMRREVICAREDLEVEAVMELMVRRHIGCIPVIDDRGHPIGMITKYDVVEQLAARGSSGAQAATVAGELMMPLAITLDEHATVAHVAAMMCLEDVHHVPIIATGGALIGIISSKDIVRWLASNDGVLASGGGSLADESSSLTGESE